MSNKDKSKYTGNELKYIKEVLRSGRITSTTGDFTQTFEQQFSQRFNSEFGVACNSGTSALHMALEGVGVGFGDEVIVPALSVIMNTTSVLHNNSIPIYADIDEDTFTIDSRDVEKKISKKTKAIVAVSLYGYPSKIEELKEISNGIPIIEDNCEHLGALRSEIGVYSLESTKHISSGEGGILLTNNSNIAYKSRLLANHGFKTTKADSGKTKSDVGIFQNPDFERHIDLGWNYRITEFQSAIALGQLENIEEVLEKRKRFAERMYGIFGRSEKFVCQRYHDNHSFWTFAVRFLESKENWRRFHKLFLKNGGDGFWSAWKLQYQEPLMKDRVFEKRCPTLYRGLEFNQCLVAETIQPQIQQYKLNYRSDRLFDRQAKALEKTIKEF